MADLTQKIAQKNNEINPADHPEKESENKSQPPSLPNSHTTIKVGITLSTVRASSKFIPDSEVFDLESLFAIDTPDNLNKGKAVMPNPKTPILFCYFDPPAQTLPEINFNQINVFNSWRDVDSIECIQADTIRSILVRPLQDFRPFDEMKMMTPEGDIVPCHLPFFGDLYGMAEVFFILLGWEMDNLRKSKSNDFLPESLRLVIDPRPVLKLDGPVHEFGDVPVCIAMRTYTDALHIMKLTQTDIVLTIRVVRSSVFVKRDDGNQRPRRWYHETVVVPRSVDGARTMEPVEVKSIVVVWSGRGVGKQSFPYHFNLIAEVYSPTLVVVVELRISQKNLVHMMDKINPSYECGMFETENFYGGVLIFWKASNVELMTHQNFHKGCKADVTVKGVTKSKIRKCLFMEDVRDEGKAVKDAEDVDKHVEAVNSN